MKQKGFTLAELLGVITILAIVALLAIPMISRNIAKGKQNLYKVQIENIKKAASNWMTKHTLEIPDGNINTSITLGCLKVEGILETSIENPITGVQFPNDMIVRIRTGSNQYIYEVVEDSGTDDKAPLPEYKCSFNHTAIES
ncbi:MAG: type II secretion system protein [Bacilli bacterium]|nr:type II secretion system protein [Bacilli bacterium]